MPRWPGFRPDSLSPTSSNGPYLLAWTPHAVLAAPYHRLSASILTAHQVFARPPQEARAILTGIQAAYVVTCGPLGANGLGSEQDAPSLAGRLQAGDVPDWLEPIREMQGPFAVYQVKR